VDGISIESATAIDARTLRLTFARAASEQEKSEQSEQGGNGRKHDAR